MISKERDTMTVPSSSSSRNAAAAAAASSQTQPFPLAVRFSNNQVDM